MGTLQYVKFTLSFSVSFAQLSELPFFAQFFTTSGAARFLSSDWLIIFFLVELVKFFDWLLVFLLADWLFHITTRSIPEGANNGLVLLFSLTEKYVNIMYGSYGQDLEKREGFYVVTHERLTEPRATME